jgi:phosphoglycerate kinase
VPFENGQVRDDFRIKKSLPTLQYLQKAGAKVIIATHLEPASPAGGSDTASVEPLRAYVPEGMELLENLRQNPGEKTNDPKFAEELASKADVFVNEAFSASHREHASIVGVPKLLPSYAGLQFAEEVAQLSKAFNPPHPFLFILGGAKFETKLPLVEKFLTIADEIFIAGAIAKPASLLPLVQNPKITLPLGDVAALDADDANIALMQQKIVDKAFVLWNGPLGKYEAGYTQGTLKLAQLLADSGKQIIVGGGDTLTAIKTLNLFEKFTFVSTAGGAMLDFLANETLPGIEALES